MDRTYRDRRQEVLIRINPLDTPWFRADVEATMVNPPDSYLIPKLHGPGEVRLIDRVITDLERQHGHPIGGVKLGCWIAVVRRTTCASCSSGR